MTSTPSATAAPIGWLSPDNFPDDVNPLTGEAVDDPLLLSRRPLAVKVSNNYRVRPQAGLSFADLIFEHYAEGGITRFTAIFYGEDASRIGSIRSGRLIDLELPKMYDAGFAFSGSSGPLHLMFRDSPFFDRIVSQDFGHGGFQRLSDPTRVNQPYEDTLYTDTYTLHAMLEDRGENNPPAFQNGMSFLDSTPLEGNPAATIELNYTSTNVFYQYSESSGLYARWADGLSHTDWLTGKQLRFRNIILLRAHHETTLIVEDVLGNRSIEIQIWGEGPMTLFRDGVAIDGRWQRLDPLDMFSFTDLEGNVLPLGPGKSFFQIIPLDFEKLTVTP